MNNLASYAWLKEYLKTDATAEEFARELSLKSMSVEKIEHLAEKFANMVVGVIKEIKPHPDANKLRIVVTDIGARTVEIVCGGTNVAEGMKVFVALPGSKVRWHGEGDLVELAVTKIRGVESIGMICAPAEVGFEALQGGDHEIWDLTAITDAKAGTPIAEALGLDDTMLDVEITTNRPDAMGRVGLAREGAAAVGGSFVWKTPKSPKAGSGVDLKVTVKDPRCTRYMAVAVACVKVAPSPWWLQKRLLMAGIRPINNIVDITNYVLLEYAQPMHAFDYAKLTGGEIVVRPAHGESIVALDGKTYPLDGELVISDEDRPVAIAGIMGGEASSTTAATTTVVFESATFDGLTIRRTARKLNCYSDAQLLFEKGLSTEATEAALVRAVALTLEIAGGKVASEVVDVRQADAAPLVYTLRPEKARERIGVDIADKRMLEILASLGFDAKKEGKAYEVTVPYWRDHDIEGEVDLIEEVARMYGYHNMPSVLPAGAPPATQEPAAVTWERFTKRFLAAAGYDEFYSNSFVSVDDLANYGEDPAQAYQLLNPLASDQSHMRTSLMPSVLRNIELNQGHTPCGNFFELSRVYCKRPQNIPEEMTHLVFGTFGYDDAERAFMQLRGTLEAFAARTGLPFRLAREGVESRWHPTRSATVFLGEKAVGTIGEVAQHIQSAFGVDRRVMAVLIELESLFGSMQLTHRYQPLPTFPAIVRDISVLLDEKAEFDGIAASLKKGMVSAVHLVDIYRGAGVPEGKKSVTLSLTLQAADRTLTSEEAEGELAHAADMLAKEFGGILRS